MGKVTTKIAEDTNGKSFSAFKYSYDTIGLPSNNYDDQVLYSVKEYGETVKHKNTINLSEISRRILIKQQDGAKPLFTYFLDGSRKTFKIDDISYKKEVFPIIAGQIGVGCCKRTNKQLNIFKYYNKNIIVLPDKAKENPWHSDNLSFNKLLGDINKIIKKSNIKIDDIKTYETYSTKNEDDIDYNKKGIAVIQTLMVEEEKQLVSELASNRILNDSNYLLKDGSLEYRINYKSENELKIFRNNYRYVVGVSKSFNPANCVDEKGRSNTSKIANLELYHRTPVSMYTSQYNNMRFAVWYIRIRDKQYTNNAYDGILKIEQILVSDEQINYGIESGTVDLISANIINERNPVCYGSDMRWTNHLYPVYLTEKYIKSRYIGNTVFLNLF